MKEFFYEESSIVQNEKSEKFKYNIFNVLLIISYVLMVFWIIIVFFGYEFSGYIVLDLIIILTPLALFIATGILLGKFKNKFCIDYDYTLVTGSLRFSKVINNLKRKAITSFDCSAIEKLGEYGSETFNKYSLMPNVSTQILTSNSSPSTGKGFYYLVVNTEGDKKLFILESTDKLIANIMQFANKTLLDEEFVKKLMAKRK